MTEGPYLVEVVEAAGKAGILKPGDVQVTLEGAERAIEDISPDALDRDGLANLYASLVAPYKRVVLSASHIHARKRQRKEEWSSQDHLGECLRQHKVYFRRRGVGTSLDMDPKLAFGDKGITSTANDRDVFVAFMTRIGLRDAVSPNTIASQTVQALRGEELTKGMPESVYGTIFETMARKPGQNVERPIFDEAIKGTDLEDKSDEAYKLLCELTGKLYERINQAIFNAHQKLQVSLTLEKEGIAAFTLNTPFGLAIPYERSLFRVYELDEAQHLTRVCPTFFTLTGGEEDDDPFEIIPVSHGDFSDLDEIERFRIGEVYIPAVVEQLNRVSEFALDHCQFDVVVLGENLDSQVGSAIDGSGGVLRKVGEADQDALPKKSKQRGTISGIFERWDGDEEDEEGTEKS